MSSKTRWDPGCRLRLDGQEIPQADPGRLQTCAPAGRACRGLGLLFQGVWCPSAGEGRSRPRVGGGVVVRRVEKGRRRLPESRTVLNGCAVGVTAGSSLGQPLRGLPKPGDTSCVIISITVSYILTRRQHGVRHLPNGICPRDHVRSKDKPLTLEVAGPRGGLEPRPAGHTQEASHCVAGEGPQLQGLGFLICELGILCPPCPPLSEDDLRWTCVGVVCEVVTKQGEIITIINNINATLVPEAPASAATVFPRK